MIILYDYRTIFFFFSLPSFLSWFHFFPHFSSETEQAKGKESPAFL